jgi:hypothetical protein
VKLYNNKNTKNFDTPADTPKTEGCRWMILDRIGLGKQKEGKNKIDLKKSVSRSGV